jgi:hypothetical protein
MKKKYQVFISSTLKDLKEERQAIAKAVIDMGFIPSGMESFPATSTEQLRYIQRVIDDCDYYVLVIGGRYGSTTTEGISFTESEYDYAVTKQKTVLAFIHENPDSFAVGVTDGDSELKQKLQAFREKASTGRVVKFWSSKDELALHAMTSLHHAAEDYPGIGWVRGDFQEAPDVKNDFSEIHANHWRLQHEVTDLTEKLHRAANTIFTAFMDKTKPATQSEISEWVEGAKANYPDVAQRTHLGRTVRYADQDFILPSLYGASSATVIVAKGVRVYRADEHGHSTLLYMDGFRREGT